MHVLLKTIACMFSKVGGEERRGEEGGIKRSLVT